MMDKTLTDVLLERARTHGDFTDQARATTSLKNVVKAEISRNRKDLTPTQLEAIDMIMHKIGRIIAGDPNSKDHWNDIAGYATIVAERI